MISVCKHITPESMLDLRIWNRSNELEEAVTGTKKGKKVLDLWSNFYHDFTWKSDYVVINVLNHNFLIYEMISYCKKINYGYMLTIDDQKNKHDRHHFRIIIDVRETLDISDYKERYYQISDHLFPRGCLDSRDTISLLGYRSNANVMSNTLKKNWAV